MKMDKMNGDKTIVHKMTVEKFNLGKQTKLNDFRHTV